MFPFVSKSFKALAKHSTYYMNERTCAAFIREKSF